MKNTNSQPIKTILTISMGFILVFYITHSKWYILVSFIIGVAGLSSTYLAIKIDWLWMKLTYILSLIVPNILLSIVFYCFLFPIALLSKLFGKKDPLLLKKGLKSTYMVTNKSFEKSTFEKSW